MASKLSLNATNLEALGAARLAELLMELSGGDAVAKRQLRLALAAGSSAEEAAREVRKRLVAIARSESYIDWRKRKTLVSDLQAQHRAITGAIATADPALALDLLWRFLELAEGIMDRCSDSTGTVIEVFQQAVLDLGPLASAAQADPLALAEQVTEALAENGYGQFDQLIPAVAEALGEKGLAHLEQECRERGAQPGHPSLLTIAECRGDVDAYVSQFTEDDLQWPDSAAQVAERLLKADRAQEALAVLDQAARAAQTWHAPHWDDTRIAVLEALGKGELAQGLRWSCFEKTLSMPHLRDYLKRLPDFEDVEAEERAFEVVEQHPRSLEALRFLVNWPALPRAAKQVLNHWQDWNGEAFELLAPAAERLGSSQPLAATLLLRLMVVFTLGMGRAKRYRYAVEQLQSCGQLAAVINDWQTIERHENFVARLREAFGLKWSFWAAVDAGAAN
ncbi:MAG: DUF6880 family protein [Synechococcus lacustris]|jgi:tetratricopeptide (TPR) repeat protein